MSRRDRRGLSPTDKCMLRFYRAGKLPPVDGTYLGKLDDIITDNTDGHLAKKPRRVFRYSDSKPNAERRMAEVDRLPFHVRRDVHERGTRAQVEARQARQNTKQLITHLPIAASPEDLGL